MSAVLKPVVEEGKNLAIILAVSDELPADFYGNKKYADQLRGAIDLTKGLVYPLDEAGEKMAKADATAINKYATQFKKYINDTFKRETDEVSRWKTNQMALVNELLDNRQKTLDQFAEKRLEKLAEIRTLLVNTLLAAWDEIGVWPEYRKGDIESLVLLGSMTEGGKLTKKADGAVRTIANGNLVVQNRIINRHIMIENRCLRADINPPLSHLHFGELFFTADDATFDAKLEALVDEEVTRRAEMAERIKKQQEAETQRKIDEALKRQQAESEQYEKEKAKREAQAKWEEEQRENGSGSRLDAAKAAAKAEAESQTPASASVNGRRSVVVTAKFRFDNIRDTVSNEGVEKYLISILPDNLQKIATIQESHNA
jgi:hypothetical protein